MFAVFSFDLASCTDWTIGISHVLISHFFFETSCVGREGQCRDVDAGRTGRTCTSFPPSSLQCCVSWGCYVPQKQPLLTSVTEVSLLSLKWCNNCCLLSPDICVVPVGWVKAWVFIWVLSSPIHDRYCTPEELLLMSVVQKHSSQGMTFTYLYNDRQKLNQYLQ